jgi:uncharacterized protein YhbP (UPF0306 family)
VLNFEFVHPSDIIALMVKRTKLQIKEDIFKFIKANGIMTLGTYSTKGPWCCTVYYGVDGLMNLYIVTDPRTAHAKNIVLNGKAAFNIFDSHQKIVNPKKGVQGFGKAELVKGLSANLRALLLWHKQNPGIEKSITIKDILKKITDTKIYKITPTYLKFFNDKLYDPEDSAFWQA